MTDREYVECSKCGIVHYAVTRVHAAQQVSIFNSWYERQGLKTQAMYGGQPSSITTYEQCQVCGSHYKNMNTLTKRVPHGVTLSPMIWEQTTNQPE